MAGEQLERSILERKERDELHAIASAMALKPASRSRKADIIDLILTATGVGVDADAVTTNGASEHANGSNGTGARSNGSDGEAAAAPVEPSAESEPSGRPRRSPRATTRRTAVTEDPATLFGDGPSAGVAPAATASVTAAQDVSTTDPSDAVPEASEAPQRAPRSNSRGRPARVSSEPAAPAVDEPVVVDESSSTASASDARAVSSQGGDAQLRTQTREPRQHGAGQQHSNGQPQSSNGQQGQGSGPGSLDAGNRRGRRRRGRERGERGEVQGAQESSWQGELVPVKGLLDLREEGYGFLRTSGYLASNRDVYVSVSQARKFALRKGDAIEGACRPAGPSEKYPALLRIDSVGGLTPDEARQRRRFEDLTPLFPDETLRLEQAGDPANMTARIVDLISPIGKGQRGMIVSPPKAGKTTIMKQIAHSIEANNPDVHLIVLLVDERPEEVTDMRRSVRGEVIASTFDRPADEHTAVAELTIERAKRLVELGRDVVIILDGITRLARAYNLAQPATGRIMSGGVDSGALYPPKRFFGAARNIEEGGSLTILATALVETGSKMDEVIFEEFKGTGNMELRLDRKLAERRLYPAIDVNGSSTRHEELLFDRSQLQQVWKLRRVLNALSNEGSAAAGLELLIDKIRTTRSNDEFLAEIAKAPVGSA
ncbi:MAG: transcription termination factor Rho [Acidimicrobiaceae bacterium]|nr:transcription termination factor Rho [Acidimicrobiaceae bacterium]